MSSYVFQHLHLTKCIHTILSIYLSQASVFYVCIIYKPVVGISKQMNLSLCGLVQHGIDNSQELHDALIQVQILQALEQVRVSGGQGY